MHHKLLRKDMHLEIEAEARIHVVAVDRRGVHLDIYMPGQEVPIQRHLKIGQDYRNTVKLRILLDRTAGTKVSYNL